MRTIAGSALVLGVTVVHVGAGRVLRRVNGSTSVIRFVNGGTRPVATDPRRFGAWSPLGAGRSRPSGSDKGGLG